VSPKNRLVAISHGPQPLVQVSEIHFQILPVLFLRYTIHPYCCIFSLSPIGTFQRRLIN
jgi:hypothetical protein